MQKEEYSMILYIPYCTVPKTNECHCKEEVLYCSNNNFMEVGGGAVETYSRLSVHTLMAG